jgi:hypothetical protein
MLLMIHPIIYRICASSCGALSSIPLDIVQTKILSGEKDIFKINELKWTFLMTFLFTIQNSVYEFTSFIPNKSIRGTLSGLSASPFYILVEMKKMKNRLGLYPFYKKFIFWLTFREIIVYVTIYNLFMLNIPYSKLLASLLSNGFGFPLKIIAFKNGYPTLNYSYDKIKKTALIEIIKSSIGDSITLYLIYNFPFSPLKI